jgi:hypothetical protein
MQAALISDGVSRQGEPAPEKMPRGAFSNPASPVGPGFLFSPSDESAPDFSVGVGTVATPTRATATNDEAEGNAGDVRRSLNMRGAVRGSPRGSIKEGATPTVKRGSVRMSVTSPPRRKILETPDGPERIECAAVLVHHILNTPFKFKLFPPSRITLCE